MPVLGIRDYLYATILLALIAAFSYWTIHERHIGQAEIVAADQRTALVAQAKDKAIEAAAQSASNSIGTIYEKLVSAPVVGDLGVVCVAPRRGGVPPAPGDKPGTAGATDVGVSGAFDPSGYLLTLLRDDDAKITALQAQVVDLVSRLNGSAE